MFFTAQQAGVILGVSPRRVRAIAAHRNIRRRVRSLWLFTIDDIKVMSRRIKPGARRRDEDLSRVPQSRRDMLTWIDSIRPP